MIRLLFLFIGYLFGLIQAGYFYGKIKKVDFTKMGSGNAGATNAFRTMGLKAGLTVWFFDMLKGFIPCHLVLYVLPKIISPDGLTMPLTLAMFTALGVILGNDYPFYLKFKGGKGVAAMSGIALAIHPLLFLLSVAVFAFITWLTGYVSLASMISSLVFALSLGFYALKKAPLSVSTWEIIGVALLLSCLLILRHRSNIKRLLSKTENRFATRGKYSDKKDSK